MNVSWHPRNAVVTGGTDGIGKEIARGLARAGHRLILVGRDAEKGARAAKEILETTGNAGVRFIQKDLSLVNEVNRLTEEVALHFPVLHYLVHSAGVVRGWRELTPEGVESNFAINFLGRFALTLGLLPTLRAAGQPGRSARILLVSGAARNGKIHFDDVNLSENFGTLRAVLQFCKANDVFTAELARRLASDGGDRAVTITCLKIGVVKTNIRRDFPGWMKLLVPLVLDPVLGQTTQEAAEPALRLLLGREFEGITGELFLKIKKFRRLVISGAQDQQVGSQLWDWSERVASSVSQPAKRRFSLVNA